MNDTDPRGFVKKSLQEFDNQKPTTEEELKQFFLKVVLIRNGKEVRFSEEKVTSAIEMMKQLCEYQHIPFDFVSPGFRHVLEIELIMRFAEVSSVEVDPNQATRALFVSKN